MQCGSEVGLALTKRIEKNRDKLFTFLNYDGVPWNNNNAEHAVRAFTRSETRSIRALPRAPANSSPYAIRSIEPARVRHAARRRGAAWPFAARAQQAGRTYRLGVLHNQGPQAPQFPPFYDELRRLGFVEGQNLIVDSRGYAARNRAVSRRGGGVGQVASRCHPGGRSCRVTGRTGGYTHDSDFHLDRRYGRAGTCGVAGTSRRQYHRHQHSCDRARRKAPGNPDGDGARCSPHSQCSPTPIPRRLETFGRYRKRRARGARSLPCVWSSGPSRSYRRSRR